MKRKTLLGHSISDIIGICIMLIPFFISILWEAKTGLFRLKRVDIMPELTSAAIACMFYLALIVRTDFFKKDTAGETIFSIVRSIVNIWVLASMIEICLPNCKILNETVILTIAFAWLGMKSVAGYGWAIFLISGAKNIVKVSKLMGPIGAIYIIAIAIGLFLQVYSLTNVQDFWSDFSVKFAKPREIIRDDMQAAGRNASRTIEHIEDNRR